MLRNERSLLLSIVALLAILNLAFLLQGTTTTVQAEAHMEGEPALGPASSLALVDSSEDGGELVLRNETGHLAWGEHPQQRAWSVGFVHIGPMLTQLMDSEEFKEEREGLTNEAKEKDEDYGAQLEAIGKEWEDAGDDEAAREAIGQQGQQLYQEYQQFQQEVEMIQQALAADQLERSYRELIAAVNVVADRLDIDIVERFIPTEDEFNGVSIETAMQEIRLRSALRYPEACDISSEVREELNLQDE